MSACFGSKQPTTVQDQNTTTISKEETKTGFTETRQMTCDFKVLEDGDSLRVYLALFIPRLSKATNTQAIREELLLNYGVLPDYSSKEFIDRRKVTLSGNNIHKTGDKYYTSFNVEKRTIISAILYLEILDSKTSQKTLTQIPVNYAVTKIREKYGLFNSNGKIPVFSNYILDSDTVQIRSVANTLEKFFVKYYAHGFTPASPPMAVSGASNLQKEIEVDSTFTIQTGQNINFKKPGLYLVLSDTNTYYGLSFYVAERKYPKLSRIKDLIAPLVYITTEDEFNSLKTTDETKKEMDKLWLKLMSGNVRIAKLTIKEYYNRVKQANQHFTTYKEGWKTDMGMIFIVYGPPNRVIRTNDSEHWFYTQATSFSEIKFTFSRKPNQFTDNSYSLIRFPEYEQVWYPTIELWREGKI